MSNDSAQLVIAGKKVDQFISFRAEADLFNAADAFDASFSGSLPGAAPGMAVKLYINGVLELTGIADSIGRTVDKSSMVTSVRGRDLMGLLVDSCCEKFGDAAASETLQSLAGRLLVNVPFINRKNIIYGKGTKTATSSGKKESNPVAQRIDPGKTIFDVLREAAASRGMLFWAMPDGTFVFGTPRTSGKAEFSITVGKNTNAESGSVTSDISGRHSKIVVVDQNANGNALATVSDSSFPFAKPLVTSAASDGVSPAKQAQLAMNQERLSGFSLSYTVPGHSQNGRNWAINSVCRVKDEALEINGDYLIAGRTFSLDKDKGATTELTLSLLGILTV